jgi:hypothetical protein
MRVWGWTKTSRNSYRFGTAVYARIEKAGDGYYAIFQDKYFGGRYDSTTGPMVRWIDAYNELTDRMKNISHDVKQRLDRDE